MWLDIVALILFVAVFVGAMISVFLTNGNGLAIIQCITGILGVAINTVQVNQNWLNRITFMSQAAIVWILRVISLILLAVIILLQVVLLFGIVSKPAISSSPTVVVPTQILTPTPTFTPTPIPPPSVAFSSPVNGGKVAQLQMVQGTADHIPQSKELWLFIVPSNVTDYFPQEGPIDVSTSNWSVNAHIGNDNDPERKFQLFLVLIDKDDTAAHQSINNFFSQSGVYKGIQLPKKAKLMPVSLSVVRE